MIRKEQDGIHFLEFELFAKHEGITHGSFLRHNVGFGRGDSDETILENRGLIASVLSRGSPPILLVSGNQVHGNRVVSVHSTHNLETEECDALITNRPHVALMIKHADCQAALFYDPVNQAIGAAHAGWRGSVQNIYRTTIQAMQQEFHTRPENLLVAISPSLGPKASEFRNYLTELPEEFYPFQIKPTYFDFWEISRMQLEQARVRREHIQIAELCTYSNPQDHFSHRHDKATGRHATAIALT